MSDLKEQVIKTLGISEERQRLFYRRAQGSEVELDEGWRTLASNGVKRGDTVLLVVREPWQRTEPADAGDGETTTVRLTLPEACVGVFEAVLDYMYGFHRDPRAEHALPDLSAESAVGALWLAGRLEMAELQERVVEHLRRAVTAQSAAAYVSAAVRLGLVKVREAAMRVAAAGLGEMAAGACDGLPLEAMEQLLGMAEESGAGAGGARDRVVASYLRAYDGGGRLDEEAYRRLMRRHSASARLDAGEGADGAEEDGEADGEGIGAEDALLLLDMAIRCAHADGARQGEGRGEAGGGGGGGGAGSGTRGWSGGAWGWRRGGSGRCGRRTWGGCRRGWWRGCWGRTGWRRGARTTCTGPSRPTWRRATLGMAAVGAAGRAGRAGGG